MNSAEWSDFLGAWEKDVKHIVSLIPEHVLSAGVKADMFGHEQSRPPASEEAIAAVSERFNVSLPMDVTNFYLSSNGWIQLGFDEYALEIFPVEKILRFNDLDRELRSGISGYSTSLPAGAERKFFREIDLEGAIVISDQRSGCYLVNPSGPFAGECSVLRWHGTPRLFASFADLMQAERLRCLNELRSLLD